MGVEFMSKTANKKHKYKIINLFKNDFRLNFFYTFKSFVKIPIVAYAVRGVNFCK